MKYRKEHRHGRSISQFLIRGQRGRSPFVPVVLILFAVTKLNDTGVCMSRQEREKKTIGFGRIALRVETVQVTAVSDPSGQESGIQKHHSTVGIAYGIDSLCQPLTSTCVSKLAPKCRRNSLQLTLFPSTKGLLTFHHKTLLLLHLYDPRSMSRIGLHIADQENE